MAENMGLMVDMEMKVAAAKLLAALKDSANILPKAMPAFYQSIQILEGDGYSAGTLRLVQYNKDVQTVLTFSKERILEYDEEKMKLTYEVIDGETLKIYKVFKPTLHIIPETTDPSSCTCLFKWSVEYEALNAEEGVPPALLEHAKETAIATFKALEAYLTSPSAAA